MVVLPLAVVFIIPGSLNIVVSIQHRQVLGFIACLCTYVKLAIKNSGEIRGGDLAEHLWNHHCSMSWVAVVVDCG